MIMVMVPLHCVWHIAKELGAEGVSCIGGFPGEEPFYEEHLKAAVKYVASHMGTFLVLSGGRTRWAAGPVSEAESALALLEFRGWYGHPEVASRTILESFAKTSFENVLYSIACFRYHVGEYPSAIVVCGWEFKAERFDLHRLAIGYPRDRWEFLGINNPPNESLPSALAGELRVLEMVKIDLYMRGGAWDMIRAQRNPFHQEHTYRELSPEMADFFDFLEENSFRSRRPWVSIHTRLVNEDVPAPVTVS